MSNRQGLRLPILIGLSERAGRLSAGRRVVAIAAIAGFVSGFLPWYDLYQFGISSSENGWENWGTLALLLFPLILCIVLLPLARCSVRTLFPTMPGAVTEARLVTALGALAALAAALFMITEDSGLPHLPGVTRNPDHGAHIGLGCALVVLLASPWLGPEVARPRALTARLSVGRRVVALAALAIYACSFLPWYGVYLFGTPPTTALVDGWGDWAAPAIMLCIISAAIALLPIARASLNTLFPALPRWITEARVVLVLGALATACIIIFIVTEGGSQSIVGTGQKAPTIGGYLGLCCVLAALTGGVLMARER